ncbi:hypothetical protein H1O16_gp005 [Burkholderia phage BcepSaruman]|uniref:Heme exporter protein D n=1 Tax=Burkholderia phage BcepSaruman TaxID=2530032 RepID=A0A4D5ZH89_9CAUD|nr:hypothetical protein H1O16_gp005 [Burkholderia phage BcepSaruman]QBX06418.1 hypothetical protein BcepSaruman_005 [Burkholderia phage BcepSaruman]
MAQIVATFIVYGAGAVALVVLWNTVQDARAARAREKYRVRAGIEGEHHV